LGVFFYNAFLFLFKVGTQIASLFNAKARKWVNGRRGIFKKLADAIPPDSKVIWMHCASLGEFEQGRPLLEKLTSQFPSYKVLLTFFSPSGYEVQKDYKGADWVFYLPIDGPRNAKRFLEIVHPSLVIFVKYEFWYYYLKKIKYRNIPLLLVSALFRNDMSFFKWYGGLQRKMLSRFDHLFVQNESSKQLMDEIGLADICTVSGDTRFDRVAAIAESFQAIPAIEKFIGNNLAIVAGSTWKEDEEVLQKSFTDLNDRTLKLIVAPHEITQSHIDELQILFQKSILFSELPAATNTVNTLIIDNIGMLSRLYRYAHISLVGGAFRKSGVHNVLEAAVYGKPVLYGPEYKKYSEAVELIRSGGGVCIRSDEECTATMRSLLKDKSEHALRSRQAAEYVRQHQGATVRVLSFIRQKRYLEL
jgi:3-deoxy-D-manno-octulosonic-acid transferase